MCSIIPTGGIGLDREIYSGIVGEIPVFYHERYGVLSVKDREEWEIDHDAIEEMLVFKYPLSTKTVYRDIRQLPAGMLLKLEGNRWITKDVKVFRNTLKRSKSDKELADLLFEIFEDHFKRIGNKTVVIPLSGGFDSRLIAYMCKKLGQSNVVTLCYGKADLKECQISRKVARNLSLEWIFVEYTHELIDYVLREIFPRFSEFHRNISSTPHIQDLIAFFHLKENNLIPEDSVVMPGHSGDFLAGSRLKYTKHIKTFKQLFRSVLGYHSQISKVSENVKRSLEIYLRSLLEKYESIDLSDAFEIFDWRERQAKYIVNSVGVYEFFGYGWDIPLWDERLFDFFSSLDNALRIDERLYRETLKKLFSEFDVDFEGYDTGTNRFRESLKNWLSPSMIGLIKNLEKRITRKYAIHPLYGNYDFSKIVENRFSNHKPLEITYFITLKHIERLIK